MRTWTTLRSRLLTLESGATMVEYALMLALIAITVVGAVTALGLALPGLFQSAADGFP